MRKIKKFIIYAAIAAVAGVVGYLFYVGRLDKDAAQQLGRQAYYGTRGAVDDLVNTGGAPGDYGAADRCRKNLREIERGKRLVARDRGTTFGSVSASDVEKALGKSIPKCPGGGRYSIRNIEYLPLCSAGSNGNLDPKDDHIILQY